MISFNKKQQQLGLTLVELMIAMVIGLVLVGGVIQIFIANNQTYRVTENMSRMQENGRFALDIMGKIIRTAGFRGNVEVNFGDEFSTATYFTDTFTGDQSIIGTDSTTDSVTFRYRGANNTAMTDCIGNAVAAGAEVASRFFITAGSLNCLSTSNVAAQPLIDNVVDMQIFYGMTTDPTSEHDVRADCYLPASTLAGSGVDCTTLNYDQVVSVRVHLLLSSRDDNLTSDGAPMSYTFAGITSTAADNRLYREYSKTITLRNKVL
jgi:type IV pilus assembly protein PilW